ncbi:MAG: hypothetical protein D3904_07110 [Candidatus Electrothrix sp. EH2]|nr:hypothetical protein [Candidatus Electrothrix sp. EH2]
MWRDIRQWNIVGFGIIPALLYSLYSLFRLGNRKFPLVCLLLPFGMLLSYVVIILFHQNEIYWQIGTAWNRLTVQALPLLIILLVLLNMPSGAKQLHDLPRKVTSV